MMCLYPTIRPNKKYQNTIKNGGVIPTVTDVRTLWVPTGCGNCIECRKQKAREWQVRLSEDIRKNTNGKYVTLTLNNESIYNLHKYTIEKIDQELIEISIKNEKKINKIQYKKQGYKLDNEIAKNAVGLFLGRWRKEYKTSVRHWLVTELGHNGTENIHIHGIIWTDNEKAIERIWQYGHIKIGNGIIHYVNEKTINYIVKYIHKIDKDHPHYKSKILCSKGIGKSYTDRIDAYRNKYNSNGTNEKYKTRQGIEINLPIYYRNKIYTDEEKEKLWLEKLDNNIRWVMGKKIDISQSYDEYFDILKTAQDKNKRLGYKTNEIDWTKKGYEEARRKLLLEIRTKGVT